MFDVAHEDVGPLIVTVGGAVIGTVALPVLVQEPLVTVMPRVTLPDVPAVKVMAFVPWPAVIVPLPIVQA
jgi:hypothetical protein